MYEGILFSALLAGFICAPSGERFAAKNYRLVSPLSVVSKVFEKPVNDRLVDQVKKGVLFSDF